VHRCEERGRENKNMKKNLKINKLVNKSWWGVEASAFASVC